MLNRLFKAAVKSTKIVVCCLHLTSCFGFADLSKMEGVEIYKCRCGREGAYITTTGDILSCSFFHHIIGNAFEGGFAKMWQHSEFVHQLQNELPSACKKCQTFEKCRNICVSVSYAHYKRFGERAYCVYKQHET